MVSTVDWNEWFESVSLVDAMLRDAKLPDASRFVQMDFATRNSYRTAIEELARGSRLSELDVMQDVLRTIATLMFAMLAVHGPANRDMGVSDLVLFAVLAILPAADLAVAPVNRPITGWFPLAALPALALHGGVPVELRTLVVVPTLLTRPEAIAEEIERLEIHYLACPDGEVIFALLTD